MNDIDRRLSFIRGCLKPGNGVEWTETGEGDNFIHKSGEVVSVAADSAQIKESNLFDQGALVEIPLEEIEAIGVAPVESLMNQANR